MPYEIELSRQATRDLEKIPLHIKLKLQSWIDAIERIGLSETRKIPGYHDEPLKGDRVGQRSIRLSRAYRAIYESKINGEILLITVMGVNKHEY